jgi:hypothetical protein
VFLSILESSRHELRIVHGLSPITPSPRGWEAFPTPGTLTHTRITWVFSPSAPQVPGVTPGSPLCLWCFGHPFWRGGRQLVSELPGLEVEKRHPQCIRSRDRNWHPRCGKVWCGNQSAKLARRTKQLLKHKTSKALGKESTKDNTCGLLAFSKHYTREFRYCFGEFL